MEVIIPITTLGVIVILFATNSKKDKEFRNKKQIAPIKEEVYDDEQPQHKQQEPLRVIVEENPVDNIQWSSNIFFDDDDPKDWQEYYGQEKVKEFLQLQLDVLEHDESLKALFSAAKGLGKTSLFRIVGKKLLEKRSGRYIETTPAMFEDKPKIDQLMEQLQPGDVVCIDEVHALPRKKADLLLTPIEDKVYPFADGMRSIPDGVSWLAATTDAGMLPEAFVDRFHNLTLLPLKEEDLTKILHDMPYPIEHEAAKEIARRSRRSPRELKRIYSVARDVAKRDGSYRINTINTQTAFDLLELDENGLYPHDRQILEALKNNPKKYASGKLRFAHSERAIRALTGVDESLYRDSIEPKLLRAGYLGIGTGGRELKQKAFEDYFPEFFEEVKKNENIIL